MTFLVQPTTAPEPKTANVRVLSIALAAVFVMLAVSQLYSYEDFPQVVAGFWLPGGQVAAHVIAALLVVSEVAAVPFLLSMRLSTAMRWASMICGWLVLTGWLLISLWINAGMDYMGNAGVLGATIPVTAGWWMVSVFAALGVLAAWVSWGMWPINHKTKGEVGV